MRIEPENLPRKLFHIDGAGARPDGTGSGFAWVRLDRDEERVRSHPACVWLVSLKASSLCG